jgi:transmembrane sensor
MNPKRTSNKVDPVVREKATEWFVAFCEGEVDASGRESFDRRLRTSPEHVRAYLRISALWEGAGQMVENTAIDIRELAQRTLAEPDARAVLADEAPLQIASGKWTKSLRPRVSTTWRALAACFLLIAAIAGGVGWWQLTRAPMYETAAAEQRTVRLPDGSTVQLNARSRIKLRFTKQQRAVDLIEGQALFSVAKDAGRAFVVGSDAARVRALGTQFDVYRKNNGTIVTVLEGQVAVGVDRPAENAVRGQRSDVREPLSSVLVSAGEQAVATPRAPTLAYHTNVFAATAWTEGKLMFDSVPLRDVVAEFNRIGLRHIVIEDESLLDLHVSGVFAAADPSQLLGFLRQRFGVTVTETDEEMRVGRAAHK